MTGFVLHPEAYRDIEEIWEYVAVDNLSAADSIVEEIYEMIQRLVPFPGQGHARPDLTSRPLRFQILRDYVIAYAPAEQPLLVIGSYTAGATLASWRRCFAQESKSSRSTQSNFQDYFAELLAGLEVGVGGGGFG
jgi:plasmid stabilization system protein ParE